MSPPALREQGRRLLFGDHFWPRASWRPPPGRLRSLLLAFRNASFFSRVLC